VVGTVRTVSVKPSLTGSDMIIRARSVVPFLLIHRRIVPT